MLAAHDAQPDHPSCFLSLPVEAAEMPRSSTATSEAFDMEGATFKDGAQESRDALWCATASDIADKHVKAAFGGLKEALRGFRAEKMEKPQRSMPVILALAGTSASDHHATMCRARELLHQEVPKVCTALVRPRDFASLNAANRAIGEQLQGGDSSSQLQEAEADDEDECTAASSFVSCHGNSRCMTVLCIEAADAVPKQILKDVLAYWHENCMAAEIPIVAFLGQGSQTLFRCFGAGLKLSERLQFSFGISEQARMPTEVEAPEGKSN